MHSQGHTGSTAESADPERGGQRNSTAFPPGGTREHYVYFSLILMMLLTYLGAAFASARRDVWGFSQLRHMGLSASLVVLLGVGIVFVFLARRSRDTEPSEPTKPCGKRELLSYAAASLACIALFWLLRSERVTPDALYFPYQFARNVPVYGAHITHDEMLEWYVHSRVWYYANRRLAWSVEKSYQFVSSVAGGVAIFLLLVLARLLQPRRFLLLFLLLVSGGFMQLFFGNVENYTLVSTLVIAYLLAAYLFIEGKASLVLPSMLLALAICFHLLAAFMLPSLLYLCLLATQRRDRCSIVLAMFVFVLILGGVVFTLHFAGVLPLRRLLYSHGFGEEGNVAGALEMLARPTLGYYWEIINLSFLLLPCAIMLVPLLALRRIGLEPLNAFLSAASLSMLAYMFTWNAALGVYQDWDLFAPVAIPLATLIGYNLVRIQGLKYHDAIIWGIAMLSGLHSYSWIVSNHFFSY